MNKMIPIIVLNLERAAQRKEIMIQQFRKQNMYEKVQYYFLPSYDGINLTNFSFSANISLGYGIGRKFQKAEIAIIMSHIAAIKFAQTMSFENVIILEDDVIICEDWVKRINSLMKLLPENWQHVYLSGHSDYVSLDKYYLDSPSIVESPKMVGAFSYMLNKSAYTKVTKFTTSFLTTFDDMIMHMIDQEKLKSYIYFPFMTFHNANESFVWDGETPGHLMHINNIHSSYKYFKNRI